MKKSFQIQNYNLNLIEHIRKWGFWCIDFLRGSVILKHYNEITFIIENYNTDKSKTIRNAHLDKILNHAIDTVPYYKNLELKTSILDFPVLNKLDLREHFNQLQSNKNFRNTSVVNSSGSTGITSTTIQDNNKKNRNTADILYFKHKAGFEVGHRIYYIRRWFEIHKKSKLSSWIQNIKKVEVTKFNDEYLATFIKNIENDSSNKMILSYSSALREIANYLDKTESAPINTNATCIIAMSESIGEKTKLALNHYFNTNVLSRYSNLENGLFGLQLPNQGDYYHLNWASYYFEILDLQKDVAVEDGELGRVVITDLFNFAMPIIRYDTGDLAYFSIKNKHFNGAKAITKVEGRQMDMIKDTSGNPVSSFIIFHLESYPLIEQFQLIQEKSNEYILKLVTHGEFKGESELVDLYKGYLGSDAKFKIEFVQNIPLLPSGKRRITVDNTRLNLK